jgi:hypothetical protein
MERGQAPGAMVIIYINHIIEIDTYTILYSVYHPRSASAAVESTDQRKVRRESLAYNPRSNFAGVEMLRW